MARQRWYGSLNNRLLEEGAAPTEPTVGMPCTITMYTDRKPATVTGILGKNKLELTPVPVLEWKDYYGTAFGEPEGEPMIATRTKRGWQIKGGTAGVILGQHAAYHDPSF